MKGKAGLAAVAASVLRIPIGRYIISHRDRLASIGRLMPSRFAARLQQYFEPVDLERVRIVQCDPLPIPEPPFSGVIRRLGFDYPGMATAEGITFDHVIALRSWSDNLLFHELVHVVQYRLLGVDAFARLYVRGFLLEGDYHRIPLEACAYELERRFDLGGSPFRVESEVKGWMASGRF